MAITHSNYGRLGNHIWAYCVARSIAQKKGFDFFSESDLVGIVGLEKFSPSEIHNHFPFEGSSHLDEPYYDDILDIRDNTKLYGFFQYEKYILWNRDEIISWFNVPDYKYFGDDTCVINFRGNDYKSIYDIYLPKEYYYNSIKKMDELYPGIKFVVITDDIEEAKSIFPNFPCYHFGILEDFSIIKNARYLIIANSTFSWWGAWINKNSILTIAPKHFLKYNDEYGEAIQSIIFGWIGKDGLLSKANYPIEKFVINLDRRKDRLAKVEQQISSFTRIRASEPKDINTSDARKIFKGVGYNENAKACAYSHFLLWKRLVASNEKMYLILEDDAMIDGDMESILPEIVEWISSNIEQVGILFLGYLTMAEYSNIFTRNAPCSPVAGLPHFAGGTFAYIITRNAAEYLVNKALKSTMNHPVDYFMKLEYDKNYHVNKFLATAKWPGDTEMFSDTDIGLVGKYSVVIPTMQKAWDITRKLLHNIINDNCVGEVIVINNCGIPINVVNEKLKIINLQDNIFVNPAWNLGVELSKFDNIALVNDDILLPNNIFSQLPPLDNYGILGCNPFLATVTENFTNFEYDLDGVTNISDRPNHFGVFMAFKKSKYVSIPDKYKIWCGDDWLIDKNTNNGVLNFKIKIRECATTGLPQFHNQKHLDLKLYEESLATIKIDFHNWWDIEYHGGFFDKNNNFFTKILKNKFPNKKIIIDSNPDILFFSNFTGELPTQKCRHIYYSAEVSDIPNADHLFMFSTPNEKTTRLPLWLFLIWREEIKVTNTREEFCSIIVSGYQEFRASFIDQMSKYKKVHSTGGALNNMGYITERGLNLSGKLNHQSKYKFVTAFENQISEGYVTEKILDAFRAGAVPLYYGTPDVIKDFNAKCFINYNDFNSMEEFCDFIAKVDQDDELYNAYFEEDIFAPEWRDIVYDKDHPFYTDIAKKIIGEKF